ncbi:MAG: hypothetical protein FWB88_02410 [Defluviitaleaceae bacterium]|nr:hypothetical protein [Defluviitaleaceae bacterium]
MSMIEQASKMEEVFINLQCAKTLSGFLDEYFEETNPDTAMLHARYRMYGDLNCVLYKTVSDAQEAVSQIIDEIYTQHKKPA